jgi:hypothetical protein
MSPARVYLVLSLWLICPTLAIAQTDPGCGAANVKFDISTTKQRPAAPAAQPGKALVYFLQDDLKYNAIPRPTTRFGIDGAWVGATHANSYFYVFVDPGQHHLCANWQSDVTPFQFGVQKRSTAVTHFTAEADKTYYFRARDTVYTDHSGHIISNPEVQLRPMDSDAAQVVMNDFAFSSFHQQK